MKLLFRTDASPRIGGGHVLRCLALAEATIARGGAAVFVIAEGADALAERVSAAGATVHRIAAAVGSEADARETLRIANRDAPEWIVVDGYRLAGEYQRRLADAGPLLSIDDWGQARPHHATVIVDVNIAARIEDYNAGEVLLGPRYALLRQEFCAVPRQPKVTARTAGRFLVTFGASDSSGLTRKTLAALRMFVDGGDCDWEARVVVGPTAADAAAITSMAVDIGQTVEIVRATDRIAELMRWSDLALTAGGSTLWELAFCGVPMIAMAGADNQVANVRRMGELDLAVALGWHEQVESAMIADALRTLRDNHPRRDMMSRRLQEVVDGRGCARVLERMEALVR